MAELKLENIYKIYDNNLTASVKDFNLEIRDKEFISIGWSIRLWEINNTYE